MPVPAKKTSPWEDKFREPTLDELRDAYPKPMRALFDDAHKRIIELCEPTEELVWEGHPWRWCLRFTIPNDPTHAFAWLVPNPEKPRIGACFTGEMLQAMPLHRMKKYMKEILVASHDVGGKFWSEFEITSKPQLDDAFDLLKRKHSIIHAAASSS